MLQDKQLLCSLYPSTDLIALAFQQIQFILQLLFFRLQLLALQLKPLRQQLSLAVSLVKWGRIRGWGGLGCSSVTIGQLPQIGQEHRSPNARFQR